MSIHPIPQQSIHRLVAGQAVSDLTSAVKELVENAIDAGATRVCVKLHDQGLTTIQVTDNGTGVPKSCRNLMATKHATSKLRTFGDLYGDRENEAASTPVSTLGFRGEALFSLANISESLVVSTRTKEESVGEEISFDSQGTVIEERRRPIARGVGTTVSVHGLFERLPVRRVDLVKRIKNQRMKLMKILQGYAILCLGTQFQLIDVKSSKSKLKAETVKLATSDSSRKPSLETRAASILGTKVLNGLSDFEIDISSAINDDSSSWKIRGLVSYSPASPHPPTARETHLFSINGRPVDLPNISRLVADVWKSFDSEEGRRPACILAFTLPNHSYDVNLSPDKRQVMLTEEPAILALIREGLSKLWAEQSEGKFEANEVETRSNDKRNCAVADALTKPAKEVLNKITPKSTRKKRNEEDSAASVETDKLPTTFAADTTIITPTVTQTQYEDSANLEDVDACLSHEKSTEELGKQLCDAGSNKASRKELKAWEQMKISFNRIQKPQQDVVMSQLLESEKEQSQVSTITNVRAAKNDVLPRGSDRLVELNSIRSQPERSLEDTETLPIRPKRKIMERTKFSSRDFSFSSTTRDNQFHGCRPEESDGERSRGNNESESLFRRKARAEELASKTGKMIAGKRIISPKRLQPLQGRDRDIPVAQEPSCLLPKENLSKPPFERCYNGKTIDAERGNSTVWSSFSGTQSIISQSRQSQLLMRKRRKLIQQSLKSNDDSDDKKSVVNLCKEDFLHMSIIGQFNLGFILARCRNHNLWMLDQHACDEKYNFEKLCKETVIHEQKLITPMQLELSSSEEHCILEHMDVFERNGFRFEYNPEKEPRQRLSLTALPHSGSGGDGTKAVQFGKEDVGALCAMLGVDGSSDGAVAGFGTGADGKGLHTSNAVRRFTSIALGNQLNNEVVGSSVVRLPKAIAMFASRACRRSIMIGTALSHKEQTAILKKLDQTEVPWNCAHGRVRILVVQYPKHFYDSHDQPRNVTKPTMSHIRSLEDIVRGDFIDVSNCEEIDAVATY